MISIHYSCHSFGWRYANLEVDIVVQHIGTNPPHPRKYGFWSLMPLAKKAMKRISFLIETRSSGRLPRVSNRPPLSPELKAGSRSGLSSTGLSRGITGPSWRFATLSRASFADGRILSGLPGHRTGSCGGGGSGTGRWRYGGVLCGRFRRALGTRQTWNRSRAQILGFQRWPLFRARPRRSRQRGLLDDRRRCFRRRLNRHGIRGSNRHRCRYRKRATDGK